MTTTAGLTLDLELVDLLVHVGHALVDARPMMRVEGQIAVFPNRGDGPCYACLYNDEDEWLGNQDVFPKGQLYGIEQLHDQKDQQDLV